jgi:hypothetical protein
MKSLLNKEKEEGVETTYGVFSFLADMGLKFFFCVWRRI